jgi:hypothetical protein
MESSKAGKDDVSRSLLEYIISKGSLKERKVRSLVQQLARTLSLLHKHGVVHRSKCSPSSFLTLQITSMPPRDVSLIL